MNTCNIFSVSPDPLADQSDVKRDGLYFIPDGEHFQLNHFDEAKTSLFDGSTEHSSGKRETSSANDTTKESFQKPKSGLIQKFSFMLTRIFKAKI